MAYRCDQAVFGGARDAIRCKVSGSVCAHQKMCMMEGRVVLTDQAMKCPGRDGRPEGKDPEEAAAEPVKKTARNTAAKKTTSRGGKSK